MITLNKFQLGDTVHMTLKITAIHLDEDGEILYTLESSEYELYPVKESEISTVF